MFLFTLKTAIYCPVDLKHSVICVRTGLCCWWAQNSALCTNRMLSQIVSFSQRKKISSCCLLLAVQVWLWKQLSLPCLTNTFLSRDTARNRRLWYVSSKIKRLKARWRVVTRSSRNIKFVKNSHVKCHAMVNFKAFEPYNVYSKLATLLSNNLN